MTLVAGTSDLHFDSAGHLTPPDVVAALAEKVAEAKPDAVVLAGDLGHPLANFRSCLETFRVLAESAPVGVLAGNHDVWRDELGMGSQELWEHGLPNATRELGMMWLEDDDLRIGNTAIVGSLAWYDYSAAPEHLRYPDEHYAALKGSLNNDAHWIDWPWSDIDFAWRLRQRLIAKLARLEKDPSGSRPSSSSRTCRSSRNR